MFWQSSGFRCVVLALLAVADLSAEESSGGWDDTRESMDALQGRLPELTAKCGAYASWAYLLILSKTAPRGGLDEFCGVKARERVMETALANLKATQTWRFPKAARTLAKAWDTELVKLGVLPQK